MRNQFNRTLLCLAITAISFFFLSRPVLMSISEGMDTGLIKDMADMSKGNDLFGNIPVMIFFGIIMLCLEGKFFGFNEKESSALSLLWQVPLAFAFGIFGWYGIPVVVVFYILSRFFGW